MRLTDIKEWSNRDRAAFAPTAPATTCGQAVVSSSTPAVRALSPGRIPSKLGPLFRLPTRLPLIGQVGRYYFSLFKERWREATGWFADARLTLLDPCPHQVHVHPQRVEQMRESRRHSEMIRTRLQPIQFPYEIRYVLLRAALVQLDLQEFQLTV
jgi:hypothetical protein